MYPGDPLQYSCKTSYLYLLYPQISESSVVRTKFGWMEKEEEEETEQKQ